MSDQLPELPPADHFHAVTASQIDDGYTADQMREYGRACMALHPPGDDCELDHGETVLRVQKALGITDTGWVSPDIVLHYLGKAIESATAPVSQPGAEKAGEQAALDWQARASALETAAFQLTAKLCAVPVVKESHGHELIRREQVMELVTQWRMQRDVAPPAETVRPATKGAPTSPPTGQVDPIVEMNVAMLRERSAVGIKKYGVTMADAGLDLRAWLQHALEEGLDQVNYLQSAIQALPKIANDKEAK